MNPKVPFIFTGIIQSIGLVTKITSNTLTIKAPELISELKLGSSVAVDGVCLTVSQLEEDRFTADVMPITFERTILGERKKGSEVNLELAMQYGQRFEGHMVSGHVESTAQLKQMKIQDNAYLLTFEVPQSLTCYILETGSIALNGISLTVARLNENQVMVSIIPHTWENTNLHNLELGSKVNVETDMMAKYAEKLNTKEGTFVPSEMK